MIPAVDAPKLKERLTKAAEGGGWLLLDGGPPPVSEPCEAEVAARFLGIEAASGGCDRQAHQGQPP